jgi:hypothetical protein
VKGKSELCGGIKRIPDQKNSVNPSINKPAARSSSSMAPPSCHFATKSFFDVRDTPIPPGSMPMDLTPPRERSVNLSRTEITAKDLDVFVDLFEPSSSQSLDDFLDPSLTFDEYNGGAESMNMASEMTSASSSVLAPPGADMGPINVLLPKSSLTSTHVRAANEITLAPAPAGAELEPSLHKSTWSHADEKGQVRTTSKGRQTQSDYLNSAV